LGSLEEAFEVCTINIAEGSKTQRLRLAKYKTLFVDGLILRLGVGVPFLTVMI